MHFPFDDDLPMLDSYSETPDEEQELDKVRTACDMQEAMLKACLPRKGKKLLKNHGGQNTKDGEMKSSGKGVKAKTKKVKKNKY